ncbi:hypothetical protein HO173_004131 [Letharia columbiana]|uniref:ACB domain-containing protein n=1 Tax=Letharia columbiana TaxID=112416 RepID=A0A8H6FZX9_9LECA|nr:uncharacterized protein HO173_004131 [Letharia columbiana]KAF6237930.1 hypothetical protein HO173_004131 [Letharia columbiana]
MSDSVDRVFVHALNTVKRIPRTGSARPPPADRLKLYGLYKQSTEGDVEGISRRPESNDPESLAEQQKWDAWSDQHSLSRTEAKRRYIATLIETMHKYATTTTEARELVAELEFVWDQIKSNSASSSSSSPGRLTRSQGQQMLPSYPSIGGRSGSARAAEGGGEGLRILKPVSDGEEEHDEGEEFEETRGGPFDDEEAAMAVAGQSQDLDVRNRKWRKKIEQALVKMTTEVAALREQIEAKTIGDGRRRNGLWAWMTWLVWVTVRHLVVDLALLGLLVAWARRKGDRRVEQGLDLLLQYLRHRTRKTGLPGLLQIPAQRA